MADYKAIAAELDTLVKRMGVSKEELQSILAKGEPAQKAAARVQELEASLTRVQEITRQTQLTDEERRQRISQLEEELKLLELINSTSPDTQERVQAQRQISRCAAVLGAYKAAAVLCIEHLLDDNKDEMRAILDEAAQDIASRQDLQRVLKGVEVLLRATVYTATVTARMAGVVV